MGLGTRVEGVLLASHNEKNGAASRLVKPPDAVEVGTFVCRTGAPLHEKHAPYLFLVHCLFHHQPSSLLTVFSATLSHG